MYRDLRNLPKRQVLLKNKTVAEHSVCWKRYVVKYIEDIRKENAGISNKK